VLTSFIWQRDFYLGLFPPLTCKTKKKLDQGKVLSIFLGLSLDIKAILLIWFIKKDLVLTPLVGSSIIASYESPLSCWISLENSMKVSLARVDHFVELSL